MAPETTQTLALPLLVASPIDVGRLLRELQAVDNELTQFTLRQGGGEPKLPKTSQLLDQTVEINKLDMLQPEQRQQLVAFLTQVKTSAPVLHISFSADPSPLFVQKIMTWLRKELDPLVLMTVGLQPSIGAGCMVRAGSKFFDLSIRQDFAKQRPLLMQQLQELRA